MRAAWLALAGLLLGCQGAPSEPASRKAAVSSAPAPAAAPTGDPHDDDPSYRVPAPERLVALGDLHGDLAAFRRALRVAKVVDEGDRWIGGALVVVQTGDQIDRGDEDRAVLELIDRLDDAARAAGGRFIALNGNHEAMNVSADFRYVTKASFAAFDDVDTSRTPSGVLGQFPGEQRGRLAAFLPGGPFALRLARRDAVMMVGSTVFVHGGVTIDHVRYGIGRLNREIKSWMGGSGEIPAPARDPEGPLWTRRYSGEGAPDCTGLTRTLAALGAKRMVVGHTPQQNGITNACDGKVWRIDTGLSHHYGGPTEALEIRGETVAVLRAPK